MRIDAPLIAGTEAEVFHRRGLVGTVEATLVACAVHRQVIHVVGGEALTQPLDVLLPADIAEVVVGEVGMHARPVPIAGKGPGVQVDDHAVALGDQLEQVAGDDQIVAGPPCALAETLEFPLPEHHLGIDAGDPHTCGQADIPVLVDDVSAGDVVAAHGAVVGALGLGVSALGEAERTVVGGHQDVLLFESEPELLGVVVEQGPGVGGVDRFVGGKHLAQHDVAVFAERVVVDDAQVGARSPNRGPRPAVWSCRRTPTPGNCRALR